jgi:hypothetical protein
MNNTNQKKQMYTEELTLFQQIAVEGEIAAIMHECSTDKERMYYAYLKLALCDDRYLLVYKNEFMKYLDEEQVNDIVGYRYSEIIPVYLFVDKFIKELKGMLGGECGNLRIFRQPIEVVKSKFIVGMRELLTYIPTTASALLDGIMNSAEADLEFLIPIVFALKQDVEDSVMEQSVGYDVKIKLLSTPLDKAPIMNLPVEDERLKRSIANEGLSKEERVKNTLETLAGVVKSVLVNIDEDDEEFDDEPTQLVYIVEKIDKSNNAVVFTKEFETQQQATEYIKNAVKDYPEIAKRFNFTVKVVEV